MRKRKKNKKLARGASVSAFQRMKAHTRLKKHDRRQRKEKDDEVPDGTDVDVPPDGSAQLDKDNSPRVSEIDIGPLPSGRVNCDSNLSKSEEQPELKVTYSMMGRQGSMDGKNALSGTGSQMPSRVLTGILPAGESKSLESSRAQEVKDIHGQNFGKTRTCKSTGRIAFKMPSAGWTWPYYHAFCLCNPDHSIRAFCRNVVETKQFDQVILVCIVIASLTMALDAPLADPRRWLPITLYVLNIIFTVIFAIEMILKMVAYGCIFSMSSQPPAYWQQPWNILDGTVVIISVIDLVMSGSSTLSSLKVLRMARALRPLRVVSRFENLRLVVQTLFASVPALANVLIVGVLVFLIFALFFLSYFKGKFYACMDVNDGELINFAFDKNVTYIGDVGAPKSLFLADGSEVPLTAADWISDLQPNLLCVDRTSGVASAAGSLSESSRWSLGPSVSCPAGQLITLRSTRDMPICVGHCDPSKDKDDRRPALCPAPPEKVQELPSFCPNAYDGDGLTAALQKPIVISNLDEKKGFDYYASLTRREIMFCGGSTKYGYPGCRERYCPQGCPEPPCDDRRRKCQRDCEMHPIFCSDSCADEKDTSPKCASCRKECEAQCQCSEYCEGFVKDAGNCVEQGGRWVEAISQSFNTIFSSFLTLVEISTTEGWVDVMYQAVDAVDPMMEPVRDHSEVWSIAFMFFIFVAFFFYINLCVGVIVDNYNDLKDKPPITKAQADWIETNKSIHKRKHFFPLTHLDNHPKHQVAVFRFVTSARFENFIMFCIVSNSLCMALKQFPTPSQLYEDTREILNQVFGIVFFVEMCVKLFALRINYFKDAWNRFDFCCVMASIAGNIVQWTSDLEMASAMSAIRAFRIARLFRLVRFLKGLNRMFTALLLSLPKLINVGGILFLFFFLFSVLGVQLFGKIKFHGPHGFYANFRDPGRAFLTLLRSVTGEGWNEIMHALARDLRYYAWSLGDVCVADELLMVDSETYPILQQKCLIDTPSGCGKDAAYPFMVGFTFVMSMVMVNLMIAVILEAFTDSSSNDLVHVIETCIKVWPEFDYDLDLKVSLKDAFAFVNRVAVWHGIDLTSDLKHDGEASKESDLPKPIFSSSLSTAATDQKGFQATQVPMRIAKLYDVKVCADGRVHFLEACRMAIAVTLSNNDSKVLQEFEEAEKADPRLQQMQVKRVANTGGTDDSIPLREQIGAVKIQTKFRELRARRETRAKTLENQAKPESSHGAQEGCAAGDSVHTVTVQAPTARGQQSTQVVEESPVEEIVLPREAG
jgi:hypothetical protein